MKSLFAGVATLLRTRAPADQLAEIRERIGASVVEIARLDSEIERRALPIMTGDADAARVAAACETDKQKLLTEVATMRQAEGQLVAEIAREEAADRRRAAEALPGQLAKLHVDILALDDAIEAACAALGDQLRQRRDLAADAARLAGSETLRRANDTFPARLRSAASRYFTINSGDARSVANNWLHLSSEFVGEAAHRTLRQFDEPLLDECLPFFDTEEAARAAQQRQTDRATPTVVHRVGKAWTLIRRDQFFVARQAAQIHVAAHAKGGRALAILPRAPGWIVVEAASAAAIEAFADAAN